MLTAENENEFMEALQSCGYERKLIFAKPSGNRLVPAAEIRLMPTVGGISYAIADIDMINRRGSGRYTHDVEDLYLYALDRERHLKRFYPNNMWYFVSDCEHTSDSEY